MLQKYACLAAAVYIDGKEGCAHGNVPLRKPVSCRVQLRRKIIPVGHAHKLQLIADGRLVIPFPGTDKGLHDTRVFHQGYISGIFFRVFRELLPERWMPLISPPHEIYQVVTVIKLAQAIGPASVSCDDLAAGGFPCNGKHIELRRFPGNVDSA